MATSDTAARAVRLGVAIHTFGVVGEPTRDAITGTHACQLIKRDEWEAWRESDDDDIALANACLAVERELRDAEWTALGLLDLALHGPEAKAPAASEDEPMAGGPPAQSKVLVPRDALATVARYALGWHLAPPEDE